MSPSEPAQPNNPEQPTLAPEDAVRAFTDFYRIENLLYHQAALKTGLSESALYLLYDLYETDGLTQKQLCDGNGLSKQTVNSSVRRMEAKGYVRAEVSGRTSRVWLTDYGRAYARQHVEPVMHAERAAMEALTGQERAQLIGLYRVYVDALRTAIGALPSIGGGGADATGAAEGAL